MTATLIVERLQEASRRIGGPGEHWEPWRNERVEVKKVGKTFIGVTGSAQGRTFNKETGMEISPVHSALDKIPIFRFRLNV